VSDFARLEFGDDEVAVLERSAESGAGVALGCDRWCSVLGPDRASLSRPSESEGLTAREGLP
jgi:hypothetical protein